MFENLMVPKIDILGLSLSICFFRTIKHNIDLFRSRESGSARTRLLGELNPHTIYPFPIWEAFDFFLSGSDCYMLR